MAEIHKKYNKVYEESLELLNMIKPGDGYLGILSDIKMSGDPTEENLELTFEALSDDEIINIYNQNFELDLSIEF